MGIRYRRGTPQSDGTINWSAVEQTVLSDSLEANDIQLAVDTGNYPWIGYAGIHSTGSPTVTKSANNDGTWSTASGFPHTFSGTNYLVIPIALSDDKVCCLKYKVASYTHEIIRSILWNGSSWDSEQNATSSYLKDKVDGGTYCQLCATGEGSDVHLIFFSSDSKIKYVKRTGSSWGSETIVESTLVGALSSPVISHDGKALFVFWLYNERIYYKKRDVAGTWDANATELYHETELFKRLFTNECYYSKYGNFIAFQYLTKTASPYNVRQIYLVAVSSSDQGQGADALGSRLISASDSGAGVDALSLRAFNIPDLGAGVDALTELKVYGDDLGSGVDSLVGLLAAITSSDIGAGTESLGSRLFSVFDQGAGTDALSQVVTAMSKSDSGIGADSLSELLITILKNDSGIGLDIIVALLGIPLQVDDSGVGTDAVTELKGTLVLSDSGVGADMLSQVAMALLNDDSGIGADILSQVISILSDTDSGIGTESVNSRLLGFLESGAGVDALVALWGARIQSDSGSGIDSVGQRLLGYSDQGKGADTLSQIITILLKTDSGAGAETLAELLTIINRSDVGSGIDWLKSRLFAFSDSGTGAEALSELLTTLIRSDSGSGIGAIEMTTFGFLLLKLLQESKLKIGLSQEVIKS